MAPTKRGPMLYEQTDPELRITREALLAWHERASLAENRKRWTDEPESDGTIENWLALWLSDNGCPAAVWRARHHGWTNPRGYARCQSTTSGGLCHAHRHLKA